MTNQTGAMMLHRCIVISAVSSTLVVGAGILHAQPYPSKTIRIVTSEPGGGSDFTSRLIAQGISGPMGQAVIVENRGGIIPVETVAKAAPDGHALLLSASMWVTPLFQSDLSYDPIRDFSPVTLAVSTPNILVVHPSLPIRSVKELIALARSRPGDINYATGTTGSASHIAAEKFKSMAAINMVRIPYKNAGPGITALIGGEVQLMFATAGSVSLHIKSGRLRALAATSPKPSALLPGMPTVADSGLPGYDANTLFGMFAPAKTPAEIIGRVNQEVVRFLTRSDTREKLLGLGVEAEASSPEQWAAIVKTEIAVLGKIVRQSGLRAD
jgi:tripartite-type tricarboxylate transporter receptor subunit TctC